jgi:hypothetical protein
MTTVTAGRSASSRRLTHMALKTVATVLVCAAGVVVGAQAITVTPPNGAVGPYDVCAQLLANPVVLGRSDPLVPYVLATSSPQSPCVPTHLWVV